MQYYFCTYESVQNIQGIQIEDNWTKSIPTYYGNYNDFRIGNFNNYYRPLCRERLAIDDMITQMEKANVRWDKQRSTCPKESIREI